MFQMRAWGPMLGQAITSADMTERSRPPIRPEIPTKRAHLRVIKKRVGDVPIWRVNNSIADIAFSVAQMHKCRDRTRHCHNLSDGMRGYEAARPDTGKVCVMAGGPTLQPNDRTPFSISVGAKQDAMISAIEAKRRDHISFQPGRGTRRLGDTTATPMRLLRVTCSIRRE